MRPLSLLSSLFRRRAHAPLLEIHIPISPNRHFFTMLHYFAASLRLNGGALADSLIVVSVGEDCEPYDLYRDNPWARRYNLEWRWVEREQFRRQSYFATGNMRFRYVYRAPAVMIADADTFVTGDFSDAVRACLRAGEFAGLIAHAPPFLTKQRGVVREMWGKLFQSAGLPEPSLDYEHSGFGIMRTRPEDRYCPPYFNFGVLMAPAPIMSRIGERLDEDIVAVERVQETHFKCQIALTLSLVKLGIRVRPLPLRYNMPNDERFAESRPTELRKVRIFHYLRKHIGPFDKRRDFADYAAVESFLRREDLEDVNRVMQQALLRVHAQVQRDLAGADSAR